MLPIQTNGNMISKEISLSMNNGPAPADFGVTDTVGTVG